MGDFVFLDSSFFKALIDPKDDFNKKAGKIFIRLNKEKATLVTSNYILDETFILIRARCGRKYLAEFRDFLNESGDKIKIYRVTVSDEAKAWDWILEDWSNLSFTDCVSFALMRRLGIKNVATFDSHFARVGFAMV